MTKIKDTKKHSFMANVAIVLFAQLMVKILGLVYRMVITNISGFGDAGNGFYTAGFQVYTVLLAVSSVGIPNAIAKMVSERTAVNDYRGAHNVFKSAMILFSIIGAVCSILLYLGADFVARFIVNMDGAQYVMRALAPSIFFVCVASVIRGYFQGLNNMNATSNSQMLEQVFKCALTVLLVVMTVGTMPYIMQFLTKLAFLYDGNLDIGKTPPEIMAAWANAASALATFISFIYLLLFYYRRKSVIDEQLKLTAPDKKSEPTMKTMKAILMLSVPISLASVITAINRVIDTATITRGIEIAFASGIPAYGNVSAILHPTAEQLNEYAVLLSGRLSKSDTLINMPLALNIAFATVLVPSISGEIAKGNKKAAADKITYSLLISILLILPCVVGFIVLAQPIYKVIYPNASLGSDLLAITSVSLIFSALIQTMAGALQGLGKVFVPAYGLIGGCIVKIILNVLLIRQTSINIYGAAISTIACQIVAFIIDYTALSKCLSLKITLKKYILKPLFASVIMGVGALVVYKLSMLIIASNLLSTLIAIAVAVVIYAILLVFLKILDENEIKSLPGGNKLFSLLTKLKIYK